VLDDGGDIYAHHVIDIIDLSRLMMETSAQEVDVLWSALTALDDVVVREAADPGVQPCTTCHTEDDRDLVGHRRVL
jgi:hypothetical protein